MSSNREYLNHIAAVIHAGELRPHIDRTYSLPQFDEAYKYLKAGKMNGKVIISMNE